MATEEEMKTHLASETYRIVTSPVWDMSQERAFVETLLNQRCSFFLLFFSLTIGGYVNSRNNLINAQIILAIGFTVLLLLARVLARTQRKLDACLEELRREPNHPFDKIDRIVGVGSMRKLIGFHIPKLCVILLGLGNLAHLIFLICSWKYG